MVVAGSYHRVRAPWVVRVLVTWTPHRTILKSYNGKVINGDTHDKYICPIKIGRNSPTIRTSINAYLIPI